MNPASIKCPRCRGSDHGALHACFLCSGSKRVSPEVAAAYALIGKLKSLDADIRRIYDLRFALDGLTMAWEEFREEGATRSW
jgi:hypothetical protein